MVVTDAGETAGASEVPSCAREANTKNRVGGFRSSSCSGAFASACYAHPVASKAVGYAREVGRAHERKYAVTAAEETGAKYG